MKLKQLTEMPYLHDEELGYGMLSKISKEAIDRSYTHFAKLKNFDIFEHNNGTFISGKLTDVGFNIFLTVNCRNTAYSVEPINLDNYRQVSMVRVAAEFEDAGIATLTYIEIAKKINLVSDHEQYLAAKNLWKSLARNNVVNVFVYSNDKYEKYDGKFPIDSKIWGVTPDHHTVLLIATTKDLTTLI